MAISPARLAANRTNALRSTGPRTLEGKARSSLNAVTHGLRARQPLLADESIDEYEALAAALVEQLTPETAVEELLVDEVTSLAWRLRRAARVETALFTIALPQPVLDTLSRSGETDVAVGVAFSTHAASFATLSKYEALLANRLRRTLSDLERLREVRESTATTTLVVIDGDT